MTKTPEIQSLGDLIERASQLPKQNAFWLFRGHGNEIKGDPQPTMFRSPYLEACGNNKIESGFEAVFATEFMDHCRLYTRRDVDKRKFVDRLALMRHYLLPSRLLDWSRNVLVAAYMALKSCENGSDRNQDITNAVEIVALDAAELTRQVRRRYPKGWSVAEAVEWSARQAQTDKRFWSKQGCGNDAVCKYPLAFAPPLRFRRILNQQGWFTIHPRPDAPGSVSISHVLSDRHKQMPRFKIPCEHRRQVFNQLISLGIGPCWVLPNLDGLCESIELDLRARYVDPQP